MAARIRALAADGQTRTAIAAAVQVSPATVRVALGRPPASAGRPARSGRDPQPAGPPPSAVAASAVADNGAVAGTEFADPVAATPAGDRRDEPVPAVLPVLPAPEPRTSQRAAGPHRAAAGPGAGGVHRGGAPCRCPGCC